jgi:hypothetical protein
MENKMKNYILTRITMGLMVVLVTGSWLTACSPSGTSQTDMSQGSEIAGDILPVPQYPLSVNRVAEVTQSSIVN